MNQISIWLSTLFIVASFLSAEGFLFKCPPYACMDDIELSSMKGKWIVESCVTVTLNPPCQSYEFEPKHNDSMDVKISRGISKDVISGVSKTYLTRGPDKKLRLFETSPKDFCIVHKTEDCFVQYSCDRVFGKLKQRGNVFVREDKITNSRDSIASDWLKRNGMRFTKLNRETC